MESEQPDILVELRESPSISIFKECQPHYIEYTICFHLCFRLPPSIYQFIYISTYLSIEGK